MCTAATTRGATGLKTTRYVLMYALERRVLAVETHVWRMGKRASDGDRRDHVRHEVLLREDTSGGERDGPGGDCGRAHPSSSVPP